MHVILICSCSVRVSLHTLNLQVHLPHFREPVAEVHGELLDHCEGEEEPVRQLAMLG